jgi:hypothetical protein
LTEKKCDATPENQLTTFTPPLDAADAIRIINSHLDGLLVRIFVVVKRGRELGRIEGEIFFEQFVEENLRVVAGEDGRLALLFSRLLDGSEDALNVVVLENEAVAENHGVLSAHDARMMRLVKYLQVLLLHNL